MAGWRVLAVVCVALGLGACGTPDMEVEPTSPPVEEGDASGPVPDPDAVARDRRERAELMAACLNDLGFPTQMREDGSFEVGEVVADQQDSLEEAITTCTQQVGQGVNSRIPSEAELSTLYDLMLEGRECLMELGHSISQPPTRETFVETYLASYDGGRAPWSPWMDLDGPEPMEVCPQPTEEEILRRMLEDGDAGSR